MGTYEVRIKKFCNGIAFGTDSYFIDGIFASSKDEAEKEALKRAQVEGFDEFDSWEIISTTFTKDL